MNLLSSHMQNTMDQLPQPLGILYFLGKSGFRITVKIHAEIDIPDLRPGEECYSAPIQWQLAMMISAPECD